MAELNVWTITVVQRVGAFSDKATETAFRAALRNSGPDVTQVTMEIPEKFEIVQNQEVL